MRPSDLAAAMRLKSAENWNQTEKDWKLFLQQAPEWCLVAEYNHRLIGTVTAINYSDERAWIGMMLVDKAHRRKGVSMLLLKNLLERLKGCGIVGLDATPAGNSVYKKLGFEEDCHLVRMATEKVKTAGEVLYRKEVSPMNPDNISEICQLDQQVMQFSRTPFLKSLMDHYCGNSFVLLKEKQITGYAFVRSGSHHFHIGPVVASDEAGARALIETVAGKLKGERLLIDVYGQYGNLISWLENSGFSIHRPFIRMYLRGRERGGNRGRQFAICGPEFG